MSHRTSLLAVVTLLAACATAGAEPTAASRRAPTCAPTGTALFEMVHTTTAGANPHDDVALYGNGALVHESFDAAGKSTAQAHDCLAGAKLDDAKAALASAPWTTTHNRFNCHVKSLDVRVYTASGKQVWTETACFGETLDEKSTAALGKLKQLLAIK